MSERPKPKLIDDLITEYAEYQAEARAATAAADALKARLVALVEEFGAQHSEKSKRLVGLRHAAMTTTATKMSVDDTAVGALRAYLKKEELPWVAEQMFTERTVYQLVESPGDVLDVMDIGKKLRGKVTSLLQACFRIKTSAPSLKVEVAG